MNFVLEGPKSSGKSTIAKFFIDNGYEYFHSTNETENDFDYHFSLLKDKNKRIIDRFSIGEMIYPTIYDRESKLNFSDFYFTMIMPNTVYIILYASDVDELIERIFERDSGKKEIEVDVLIESNKLFEFMAKSLKGKNILSFDVCKYSSDDIIKELMLKYEIE